MPYFMAIDIGTSSAKTIITDENGRIVAACQREYDIQKPHVSYAEQDFHAIWLYTKETIRQVLSDSKISAEDIKGIGYSGQMHGLVLVDKNGELIRDGIIWCDQRSGQQVEEVYKTISRERYHQITLNGLTTGFVLSSLLWVKEKEPENYERIYKVLLPKDYIRYQMTGEIATDISDASASLIYDTSRNDWSWEIIDKLKLERSFFPPCYESHESAGKVTKKCSEETGLSCNTVVTYGGGDSIMQQIGNGVISEGSPWIANIGTSCSCNCSADTPLLDKESRINVFSHTRKGHWMLMGANLSGGLALKWLRDHIFSQTNYQKMNLLGEQVPPGSDGLLFWPYLNGTRCPANDADTQAAFVGLTLKHDYRHMIRSVMEGIVFSMFEAASIFHDMGLSSDMLIASGGGAKGKLFREIEADVFNLPVRTNECEEQSCLGAAIAAAVGTGEYDSYEEACGKMVRYSQQWQYPNLENHKRYQEIFAVYHDFYKCNREIYHRISGLNYGEI
ncbi:MAG: xylulokinase [Blautia sp.]|jgi:xylulokinase